MTKKHEELVEGLDRLFIEECGNDSLTPYLELEEDDRSVVEEAWDKIITLILSAVHDGLELPDEVGRWNPYDRKSFRIWLGELPGGETFIALTGTGKEEEK